MSLPRCSPVSDLDLTRNHISDGCFFPQQLGKLSMLQEMRHGRPHGGLLKWLHGRIQVKPENEHHSPEDAATRSRFQSLQAATKMSALIPQQVRRPSRRPRT